MNTIIINYILNFTIVLPHIKPTRPCFRAITEQICITPNSPALRVTETFVPWIPRYLLAWIDSSTHRSRYIR